mmetsp:Transcript_418/g.579  ORF Transcript_418/g.579 Transcript_418/m.579 type:complete len:101 (+) Transcript_418:125-427(+)
MNLTSVLTKTTKNTTTTTMKDLIAIQAAQHFLTNQDVVEACTHVGCQTTQERNCTKSFMNYTQKDSKFTAIVLETERQQKRWMLLRMQSTSLDNLEEGIT